MSGDGASVFAELIPLALVVALSPVSVLPALLLVLYSARPRAAGLAFAVGWVVGLTTLTVLFVNVPKLLGASADTTSSSQLWLRIIGGAVLIVSGAVLWLRRKQAARSARWLDAVGKLSPARTAPIGLVLALVNPKIIVACAAAGLAIAVAPLGTVGRGAAVVYFVVLAGSSTLLPVLAHVVAANRFDHVLDQLRSWIQRRQAEISAVALVVIGVVLILTTLGGR
ncbi:GAP family protein [Mycolicibacterium sphagni]|uniref:GAP family protein n=1 Tax=Mycolicibacterium sphagni TaxID=1786 RepID=UPI0021F373E9|nr:GAP family protein [Mycolicibacterium sphagni]MCV7175989.1 GAP family protein [Mycolicibacterium sphagni]